MRKSIIVIGALTLALTGCGSNSSKAGSSDASSDSIEVVNEAAETEATGEKSEWDVVLDEYEELVDNNIKLMKKAQSGDMTALTEYTEMVEKLQSLQQKLENAESEMTTEQMDRMNELTKKALEASTEAAGAVQ